MSKPDPYYSTTTHLACTPEAGHTCQAFSGMLCCEPGCRERAGTLWGPYWCPDHDAERIDRISGQLAALVHQPSESEPS